MDSQQRWDVHLSQQNLKRRTFILGNKRAFSLCLPAAAGSSDLQLHPHKWFGAYLYGRKFLEAQLVRAYGSREHILSIRNQSRFTMGLTSATREYEVEGRSCIEEFFVPDGVQGFTCTISGEMEFAVEPQFDMRFYRALNYSTDSYQVDELDRGVLVSQLMPTGTYDDETETFLPAGEEGEPTRVYAAVEIVGDDAWFNLLPEQYRSRRKVFRKDQHRHRFLMHSAPDEAKYDHAPLWNQSATRVFTPAMFYLRGHATLVYGFGASAEEALSHLEALRENSIGFRAQKTEGVRETLSAGHFETQVPAVDTAYRQVLTRLMDVLVARHAVAEDTVLERPATMILAGNQYFHDSWKRDENIALGFLLKLGFYDLAREVIRDTWQLQDEATGRLPQRIRAGEEPPYNSSDGTLWALLRLYQYWRFTGDESLLYEKLPMVQRFFKRSLERAVDGMLPSGRTGGLDYLWETWMDTPHTPRHGFPVEIQMLWIACLRNFRPILRTVAPELEAEMATVEAAAWCALERFNVRGVPADSLDEEGAVRDLITPNPYFCFGLGLDLGAEVEQAMRAMGRRQLAGRQGIRTLAPQDWDRVFSAEFLSDRHNVRGRRMRSIGKFNYHRGVEWNWLSQFFVQAELKYGEPDVAFAKYLLPQVNAVLNVAGIGGISELFDLSGTRGPEFQAWSMSGFLEALHAFAGVHVDVPDRRIIVEPQLPRSWPQLSIRKWYGSVPLDVECRADAVSQSLSIEFPWGTAPDANFEIGLVLPARCTAQAVDLSVDGEQQGLEWTVEPLPGTDRVRVRCTVPASVRIDISVSLRCSTSRATLTA